MVKYIKFKQWCIEHNIKQKDIALTLGISESFCSRKLNSSEFNFTIKQIQCLCNTYKISPDIFF